MKSIIVKRDIRMDERFNSYPKEILPKIENLRRLIVESAEECESVHTLEETLKWGEPSYIAKKGSTIRMDWKEKTPKQYAMYFKCTSKLVHTFRELYGDLFDYENNRAIIFDIDQEIPEKELKTCIKMALEYHLVKNKPVLGTVK